MKKTKILSVFAVILLAVTLYGTNPSIANAQTVNTCTDGVDNDFNTLTDEADPSCATGTFEGVVIPTIPTIPPITSVPEDTYALCIDGLDNDNNTLSDAADPACATVLNPTPVTETTLAQCTDGIDNDNNTLSDAADPSCAAVLDGLNEGGSNNPSGTPENTYGLCTDGVDNDNNTLSDAADPSCAGVQAPTTPTTPTTTPTAVGPIGGGGSSGGSSGGTGITVGTPISATGTTETVGMCKLMINSYMGIGRKNNKVDVIRLQAFLNQNLGTKLKVDGIFGKKTEAAVKMFQLKYKNDILLPWDQAGLSVDLVNNPTGYFYITSKHTANKLQCPTWSVAMPSLR